MNIRPAVAVLLVLVAGGCLPFSLTPPPAPTVNAAATAAANMQTSVVQTLTAQPTSTAVPFTETVAPTLTLEPTLSPTATVPPTTVLETATNATATSGVATIATVAMSAVSPSGSASETPTLGVMTYGTLPPLVPFAHITLINRAKAEAYISLHVDLDGSNTVIEYPVNGTISIRAPLGFYRYVAWVGGREMVGEFRLKKDQDLTIVIYKDRIEIR